jgi:CheY-like chemotaxis protein
MPVTLSSTMLKNGLMADDQQRTLQTMLEDSSRRGGEIVRQLLSFGSSVDGHRIEIQLRLVMMEVRKSLMEQFPKNIRIDCLLPENLWSVEADPMQLRQVLINLCQNAREAMPDGGTLMIASENMLFDEHSVATNPDAEIGPYVVLKVSDTGTGIAPEVLEKIFDPFFTTKEPADGLGLGLSTVHGIVKSHRGFVQVSTKLGRGSVFRVYLPAIPSPLVVHEEPVEAELPRAQGELVLVVDDEEALRESIKHLLEEHGYRVMLAADGSQGLACFVQQQANVRVLVTDIIMPIMDGIELIQSVHRLVPDLPVIAMSGLQQKEAFDDKGLSFSGLYLLKPFISEQLLNLLDQCINEQAAARHREAMKGRG